MPRHELSIICVREITEEICMNKTPRIREINLPPRWIDQTHLVVTRSRPNLIRDRWTKHAEMDVNPPNPRIVTTSHLHAPDMQCMYSEMALHSTMTTHWPRDPSRTPHPMILHVGGGCLSNAYRSRPVVLCCPRWSSSMRNNIMHGSFCANGDNLFGCSQMTLSYPMPLSSAMNDTPQ